MSESNIEGKQSAFNPADITALSHLYRGELYRSTVWRTRLDATTNWAVLTTGIALSLTFGSESASPLPLVLAGVLVATFLFIEARRACFKNRETAMKIAKIILAGTAALTIISSAALAQQALTGTVTKIDRINRTIAIQQTQSGTIGANTGGAAQEFKAQDSLSLDTLHAGDKVTFSATETGGIKITKLQNQ